MIIFLDTETTALLAVEAAGVEHQPHIVELYLLKTDDQLRELDELHLLIKPPIKIPDETIKIHGITNEKVKDKKPFAGYYRTISNFVIGTRCMVGHNLQYDKRVLQYELERINKVTSFPWPPTQVCTVEETQKRKGHRMSLGDLYEELFGTRFDAAHTAEADTRALLRIYRKMMEELEQ